MMSSADSPHADSPRASTAGRDDRRDLVPPQLKHPRTDIAPEAAQGAERNVRAWRELIKPTKFGNILAARADPSATSMTSLLTLNHSTIAHKKAQGRSVAQGHQKETALPHPHLPVATGKSCLHLPLGSPRTASHRDGGGGGDPGLGGGLAEERRIYVQIEDVDTVEVGAEDPGGHGWSAGSAGRKAVVGEESVR